MSYPPLPAQPAEVLNIPEREVPDVIRALVRARRLSSLIGVIHHGLKGPDPIQRERARAALTRLGFVE